MKAVWKGHSLNIIKSIRDVDNLKVDLEVCSFKFFLHGFVMGDMYYGIDKPSNGSEEPISLLEVMGSISCASRLNFILSFLSQG